MFGARRHSAQFGPAALPNNVGPCGHRNQCYAEHNRSDNPWQLAAAITLEHFLTCQRRVGAFEGGNQIVIGSKSVDWIGRDHSVKDLRGFFRHCGCHGAQIQRMNFQLPQLCRRVGVAFNRSATRQRMKQSGSKTVDIAAKIFRLIVQPFRRDVIRRAPDFAASFTRLGRHAREPKVADLCHVFVREKNVRRLDVAVNQTFCVCRA